MANNYQQSSFQIDLRSEEEYDFLSTYMDEWNEIATNGLSVALLEEVFERPLTHREKQLVEEGWGWKREREDTHVIFFCEENGNIDAMVELLQEFLAKFRPDEFLSFTWSYTCSKMRPGEFGGGGALVGSNSVLHIDIQEEMSKLAKNRTAIAKALSSLPD